MGYPVLHVYIGAPFSPTTESIFDEPSSWTDITADVREASWQRGRQANLDAIAVGNGSLLLRQKQSRDYDPTNLDGPYFPMGARQFKIEAVHSSTTYSLFRGWSVNWRVTWNKDWADVYSEVQVDLVDAIALMQPYIISVGAGNDSISTRIGEVLNSVDFPAGMRTLSGGSQVQSVTGTVQAWEHIQACVESDTELNVCYIDGAGFVVFGDPVDSGVEIGDGGGSERMHSTAGLDYGVDLVGTYVTVTREGGTPQTVRFTGGGNSGASPFATRAIERTTLNTTDADALTLANVLLNEYMTPKARPDPVGVRPGDDDATWTDILGLDLEHLITFSHTPPGGGERFSQKMKIVGMETKANPAYADWTTTFKLAGESFHFPSLNVLDTFNRANEGPPMTGWTAWSDSGLKVLTTQCAPNDTATNDGYWTTSMTGPDVEAYITIATLPATGGETVVAARLNPAGGGASGDWYGVAHVVAAGTDTIEIRRYDNAVATVIGGPFSQNLAAGDGIGIRCLGSRIEAWAQVSGIWQILGYVTDATYDGTGSNVKLGLRNVGNGTSAARYDNFGGGTI